MAEEIEISVTVDNSTITAVVNREEAQKIQTDLNYAKIWFEQQISTPNKNENTSKEVLSSPQSVLNEQNCNFYWTRPAVLLLIELYNKHKEKFTSPVWRKKRIWQLFSEEFAKLKYAVSSTQIENKWKHLISTYKRTKDENKISGNERRTCSYYYELDGILNTDPSVEPIAVASNLAVSSNQDECNENEIDLSNNTLHENNNLNSKKRKKKEPSWVTDIKTSLKIAEENAEKRHAEKTKLLEKIIENDCKRIHLLEKFLDKLN